jgi:uncharacterized membrane protein
MGKEDERTVTFSVYVSLDAEAGKYQIEVHTISNEDLGDTESAYLTVKLF